jgi:hypothetical protein
MREEETQKVTFAREKREIPHFADSVRNDVFFFLWAGDTKIRRAQAGSACATG